jgi:hypothetical protein
MPNQSGSLYGLTILSPIKVAPHAEISSSLALRTYLSRMHRHHLSPFARVSSTHLARLVVMDDVVYFGMPSCEEHLNTQYLIFETNFDGDLDTYLDRLADKIPETVNAIWRHCVGYPGAEDRTAFKRYMKACQIETTFYFADVNNKTVQQTLRALQTQSAVAAFIERNQGRSAAHVQAAFAQFVESLRNEPQPLPAVVPAKELADE